MEGGGENFEKKMGTQNNLIKLVNNQQAMLQLWRENMETLWNACVRGRERAGTRSKLCV